MRYFCRFILFLFFLIMGLGIGITFQELPKEEELAIVHGPYLQNPAADAITVIWFTNKKCTSKIEYGTGDNFQTFPQWGSLMQTAVSSRYGLIDANNYRHVIRITGLSPGKSHKYRVVSKEILQFEPYEVIYGNTVVSEIYYFKTLDPGKEKFSFHVFQDIHNDAARLQKMIRALSWDKIDLIFLNGDSLGHIDDEQTIFNGFLDVSVELFAKKTPFLFVRGNHDTRGSFARKLSDYFPPRNQRYYYSFNHGPVHFIILDAGEDKPDDAPVYAGLADFDRYREQQAEWLKQEIQSPSFRDAPFRIAVFHMPFFTQGYASQKITRVWAPLLDAGGVELVICGHVHRLTFKGPTEGENGFFQITAPPEGSIRTDVSQEEIIVSVLDINGEVLRNFTVASILLQK